MAETSAKAPAPRLGPQSWRRQARSRQHRPTTTYCCSKIAFAPSGSSSDRRGSPLHLIAAHTWHEVKGHRTEAELREPHPCGVKRGLWPELRASATGGRGECKMPPVEHVHSGLWVGCRERFNEAWAEVSQLAEANPELSMDCGPG
jgi:hypothetical protein